MLNTTTPVQVAELERRRRRLVAEVDLGVGLVGGEHEAVLARERRGLLVQRERRRRAGRVVRVVEPQQRRPRSRSARVRRRGRAGSRRPRAAAARAPPCRRTARRARRPGRPAPAPRRSARRAPGPGGRSPPWSPSSAAPARPGPARRRSAAPAQPAIASRSSASPSRRRVGRERLERRHERLADERRRLLARLADPEVDEVDAVGAQPRLGLGQAHERVRAQAGEGGGELHAANRSRTS